MTQPPHRPGPPGRRGPGTPPPDPATRRLPRQSRPEPLRNPPPRRNPPPEPPTQRIRPPAAERIRPPAAATERIQRAAPPSPPPPAPTPAPKQGEPPRRGGFFTRRTIALLAVLVVAVLAGGLAGAELYARHRADDILVGVAECVVEDRATISYGVNPPFLWQHITGHYTNISVHTAGDRVQSADGMTADVTLEDVRLQDSATAKGTIGSLRATLTWTAAGIKDTVAANLPVVGKLVTAVRTDPAAGTLELDAGDTSVTAKPVVRDGDLTLDVLDVTGPFAKDTVQGALDELTKKLNDNYPLGIQADSVEVTSSAVVGTFSSRDASIPKEDADPCFAAL
ncbi:LmeA family phospholipid-binding protein [Mycolicibacterium sp.]|uniref:LmeA family phospholipid-binding protein n=1 Tax=Mycolicibacterium sp. TaxID=2320850 RepID=UPI003D0BF8FA